MDKLDPLGWAEGMSFEAYGLRVGVRTNRPGVLETLLNHLPPGWSPISSPEVQQLYSVIVGGDHERPNIRRFNILYANAVRVVRTMNLNEVRSGPRNPDSGLSEISIVFQAAVPKPVAPKYTTSGVRRPSEL